MYYFLTLKCTKCVCWPGSDRTRWRSLQRSPYPLTGLRGVTRREGRGREGENGRKWDGTEQKWEEKGGGSLNSHCKNPAGVRSRLWCLTIGFRICEIWTHFAADCVSDVDDANDEDAAAAAAAADAEKPAHHRLASPPPPNKRRSICLVMTPRGRGAARKQGAGSIRGTRRTVTRKDDGLGSLAIRCSLRERLIWMSRCRRTVLAASSTTAAAADAI